MRKFRIFAFILLTLSLSAHATTAPLEAFLLSSLELLGNVASKNSVQLKTTRVEMAGPDIWDRVEFEFKDGKAIVNYKYTPQVLTNESTIMLDIAALRAIVVSPYEKDSYSIFLKKPELYYNANHGSAFARHKILSDAAAKDSTQGLAVLFIRSENKGEPAMEDVTSLAESYTAKFNEKAKMYLEQHTRDSAKKQKIWETWKKQTKTLDSLDAAEIKLDDLLRNNDRKGVRHLIEAYLPWPMMEPFESTTWKTWLDALETKPTSENSEILFRGVSYDTDVPFRNQSGDVGFMSTVLTKNQGNYNRRLRSLSTSRLKNVSFSEKNAGKFPSVTINALTYYHAVDPRGSSFLSLTPFINIARKFAGDAILMNGKPKGGGGLLAVRTSIGRSFANPMNGLTSEGEVLMPLVIFPEDVVFFKESKPNMPVSTLTPAELLAEVKNSLSLENQKILERTQEKYNSRQAVAMFYGDFFSKAIRAHSPEMCQGAFK